MTSRDLAIGVAEGGRAANRQPVVLERFAVVSAGLLDPVLVLEQPGSPEVGLGKRRMSIEDLLVKRQAQFGASGLGLPCLLELPDQPVPLRLRWSRPAPWSGSARSLPRWPAG